MLVPPTDMETHKKNSVVTGQHIYKTIWTPFIGEMLPAKIEEGNLYDRYAESLTRDSKIIEHMPHSISKVSWHFLKHWSKIKWEALDFEVSSATCTAWNLKLRWLSLDAAVIITRETTWRIDHTQAFIRDWAFIMLFQPCCLAFKWGKVFIWDRCFYEEIRYLRLRNVYIPWVGVISRCTSDTWYWGTYMY